MRRTSTRLVAMRRMLASLGWIGAVALLGACASRTGAQPGEGAAISPPPPASPMPSSSPVWLDQGARWGADERQAFYALDQGSRIMPLSWFKALSRRDGTRFGGAGMARYGYLANPGSADALPVGFTVDGAAPGRTIGMTCAACHTRELEVDGTLYRVDGGPAIVDFQAFLTDLDLAVGDMLADGSRFAAFAQAVRAADPGADGTTLRADVTLWYRRYHTLIERALPAGGWGLGRLDAISMIFNRLTGLDIGTTPDRIIADNITRADAPVRYPFIWNAPKQDHTQWPGFAANGDRLLGLTRNLGEVYGVFATFAPTANTNHLLGYDFISANSANLPGLRRLEGLVDRMDAPKWPWPTSPALVAQGKRIFARATADGGCAECHGERPGVPRLVPFSPTWATPRMDVGTDTREYQVIGRMAQSGVLAGARKPSLGRLQPVDTAMNILATSVVGAILQNDFPILTGDRRPAAAATAVAARVAQKELGQAFEPPPAGAVMGAGQYRYESRVLYGIWAVPPYLHNGSVPSLAELLKPPAQRVARFSVGRGYDRDTVGLAPTQTGLSQTRVTTGCDRLNSGDSHCGHDYGTRLPAAEKAALLEYLKLL